MSKGSGVFRSNMRVIGVDEAGRGSLAGPVSVGLLAAPAMPDKVFYEDFAEFPVGRDSKQMSAAERAFWYGRICGAVRSRCIANTVEFISAAVIDKIGIVAALDRGIARGLSKLAIPPEDCVVLLDGALQAPSRFLRQRTIIRGDAFIPIISLASIAAKVARDRLMERAARRFPEYGFECHKGYGTRAHREAIIRYGISSYHRKTYDSQTIVR